MVKKSIKEGNSGPFSKLESTYLKEKAFGMVLVTKSRTKPPTIILNSPQITVMPPNIISALPCITVHMEPYFKRGTVSKETITM